MKKLQFIPISFFLVLFFISKSSFSQDFNLVSFSINSAHGNTNCHAVDKQYNFSYSITLPADETVILNSTERVVKSYSVVTTLGYGTVIDALRDAMKHNGSFSLLRKNSLEFGLNLSGSFNVRYTEAWREPNITLRIGTTIQYTEKHYINGTISTSLSYSLRRELTEQFTFPLAPYLSKPTIMVDGSTATKIVLNPLDGCKTYTLNSPMVGGANRYRWVVSPASMLVSGTASLTTRTIQINPSSDNASVRLEVMQDCDGTRTKSTTLSFEKSRELPRITKSRSTVCHNGGTTELSIPALEPGVSANWSYDGSKVQLVSGQGTNRIRIRARGNYRRTTRVRVTVNSPCGSVTSNNIELWLGAPSTPSLDPSGYPTIVIHPQSFRNFNITNYNSLQEVNNYNWWVSPNRLNMQATGTFCRIWGSQTGTYNYYVTRSNTCGTSYSAGGAINVTSSGGNNGGGGFGNPRSTNIPQFDATNQISKLAIYPNPAKNIVSLDFLDEEGTALNLEMIEAELLDLSGKLIQSINRKTFDISNLNSGVYLIKINTGERIISQKLVVE